MLRLIFEISIFYFFLESIVCSEVIIPTTIASSVRSEKACIVTLPLPVNTSSRDPTYTLLLNCVELELERNTIGCEIPF